jgi:hypothetical protein
MSAQVASFSRGKEIVADPRNAQLLHTAVERGSLHSQACGSAARTGDDPAGLRQNLQNMVPLRILQSCGFL